MKRIFVCFLLVITKMVLCQSCFAELSTIAVDQTTVESISFLGANSMKQCISLSWEQGAINGNTGKVAPTNNRIRSSFFTPQYPYAVIVDNTATGSFTIDINKYKLDGTFVGVIYSYPVFNGAVIGTSFDKDYKYRLVSTNTLGNPCLINLPYEDPTICLGCGIINDGAFSKASNNTATLKPFSVTEPSILKLTVPHCNVDLFYYNKDGSYVGKLSSSDTNNMTVYFPLNEQYIYRLYIDTTNYSAIRAEINTHFPPTQVVGGTYNGNIIASSGNRRTSLINSAGNQYVLISSAATTYCVKYKDGVWQSPLQVVETAVWSPAIAYIGDCDFFCIMSNDAAEINYTFTNEAKLFGKKWFSYGDSITEQGKWQPYLVAKYGLTHINKGLGGSCVTGNTTCTVTPMTDDTRINEIDTDADIITVMGGTNDFEFCENIGSLNDLQTAYDTSTFIGSIATIVKKLQARCPNAKIILMSNINSRGIAGENCDIQEVNQYGYTPYDFTVAMKDAAEWLSVAYIDTWSCGINQLNHATYVEDTVHPNGAGGRLVAKKVMEYFSTLEL